MPLQNNITSQLSNMTPPVPVLSPPQCQTLEWIEWSEKQRVENICILGGKPITSATRQAKVFDVSGSKQRSDL